MQAECDWVVGVRGAKGSYGVHTVPAINDRINAAINTVLDETDTRERPLVLGL